MTDGTGMDLLGLGLIACAGVLMTTTGLPAFAILCFVALCGATGGILWGGLPLAVFTALPARLITLFENDLLQALPLYVFIGLMLDRLPLTAALAKTIQALFGNGAGARAAMPIALGGLLGPMNGSVGAQVMGLCRSLYPRLLAQGLPPDKAQSLMAVAGTLGVVIPPSLVLILMGDAMMSAHTIALQGSPRTERIINTQDIFHAVLIPALIVFAGFLLLAFFQGRSRADAHEPTKTAPLARQDAVTASLCLIVLLALLGGVASGLFYAVEAAATGSVLLLLYGFLQRHIDSQSLHDCLRDTAAATGAIFALLIAATTLTLTLRLLGTDRLIAHWLLHLDASPLVFMLIVLSLVALSALVLDAFEIIFVLIPILAPPLLTRIDDALWVSVCLLLTLQLAFLLPPAGYALMLTRGLTKPNLPLGALVRAIRPYLFWQMIVLGSVLAFPHSVHWLEKPQAHSRSITSIPKNVTDKSLRDLLPPPEIIPFPALPSIQKK